MLKFLRWRGLKGWRMCLLFTGLLILISFALCHPVFETNDDAGIIAAASGALTGAPYAGNVYTTYMYGALLKALYSICAGAPWHAALMLGAVYLSLAAILKSVVTVCLRHDVGIGFGFSVFLALYMGVFAQYVVKLQYTAVAALAATAGACLGLTVEKNPRNIISTTASAFLLLFSFCLRTESFWVCAPLMIGHGLFQALRDLRRTREQQPGESRAKRRKSFALPLWAVSLCMAAVLSVADDALYQLHEPGWEDFRQTYDLQRQLLDYRNTDFMERTATEALGWPEPAVRMLRGWYLLDEHMREDHLRNLFAAMDMAAPPLTVLSVAKATGSILRRYPMFAFNFLAFGLWGLYSFARFLKARQWVAALPIAGTAVYLALFIAYFYGILGRLPERAAFTAACPCYVFLTLSCLPALRKGHGFRDHPTAVYPPGTRVGAVLIALTLFGGAATLALFGATKFPLRGSEMKGAAGQKLYESACAYADAHPSLVYVTDIPQRRSPFDNARVSAVNLIEWGHSLLRSPMYQAKLRSLGFDAFDTDSLLDPRVRVITSSPQVTEALLAYLKTTNAVIAAERVDEGAGFGVYRFFSPHYCI